MTTDINKLLRGLKLYIGVPLAANERKVADDLYEQLAVWCKEAQADRRRDALREITRIAEEAGHYD